MKPKPPHNVDCVCLVKLQFLEPIPMILKYFDWTEEEQKSLRLHRGWYYYNIDSGGYNRLCEDYGEVLDWEIWVDKRNQKEIE